MMQSDTSIRPECRRVLEICVKFNAHNCMLELDKIIAPPGLIPALSGSTEGSVLKVGGGLPWGPLAPSSVVIHHRPHISALMHTGGKPGPDYFAGLAWFMWLRTHRVPVLFMHHDSSKRMADIKQDLKLSENEILRILAKDHEVFNAEVEQAEEITKFYNSIQGQPPQYPLLSYLDPLKDELASRAFAAPMFIVSDKPEVYQVFLQGPEKVRELMEGQLSNDNTGCNKITDESACLGSKDGRKGQWFSDSPCHWCCGEKCTASSSSVCSPKAYLLNQPEYTGHSKNGLGENSCKEYQPPLIVTI